MRDESGGGSLNRSRRRWRRWWEQYLLLLLHLCNLLRDLLRHCRGGRHDNRVGNDLLDSRRDGGGDGWRGGKDYRRRDDDGGLL